MAPPANNITGVPAPERRPPSATYLRWALRGARLIGIALLAYLLSNISWPDIWVRLTHVHGGWLAIYLFLFPCSYVVKTMRLRKLVSAQRAVVPGWALFRFTIESGLFGSITPGRFGELTKVGMLRASNVPVSVGLTSVFLERAFDIGLYLVMGVLGAIYFLIRRELIAPWALAADSFVGLAVIAITVHYRRHFAAAFEKLNGLARSSSILSRLVSMVGLLRDRLHTMRRPLLMALGYSILVICFNFGQIYALSRAVTMDVPYVDLLFAYSLASLVTLIPISIAGLGTREATYVLLLGNVAAQEAAVTFSLLDGTLLPVVALTIMNGLLYAASEVLRIRSLRSSGRRAQA